jgi:hypothetical protein
VGKESEEAIVNTESLLNATPSINGHMMDLDGGHMIAVYQRGGVCWVAEFRDGHGELHDAAVWFRFHAGALRYCHNRRLAALKSTVPLIPEMLEKIERLHRASEAREERILAAPRTVAAVAQRWAFGLMSHLRGRESKIGQTPASLS